MGRADAETEAPILWPLDAKSGLTGKDPDESKRRKGWQRMRWLESITDVKDMNLSQFQEIVKDRSACHAIVHGVAKSWT